MTSNSQAGNQISPDISEYQTSMNTIFYSTGTRKDKVGFQNNSSYKVIGKELSSWRMVRSEIVNEVNCIIKTGTANIKDVFQRPYLYDFTYLLYNEAERNVASLLTNAIFFALVADYIYNLNSMSERLPMAIRKTSNKSAGAVQGSRYLLDLLGGKYGRKKAFLSKR